MRNEGWESLLATYIEALRQKTFRWGKHDCALACAEWVRIATGNDLSLPWAGLYENEEELDALMLARGFSTYEHIADSHLISKPVMLAKRGDILLHPSGTLGICTGTDGVFVTARGIITEKTLNCPKAWEV
jgi:hypothetical protein